MATRPPIRPARRPATPRPKGFRLRLRLAGPLRPWVLRALIAFGVVALTGFGVLIYSWVSYGRMIEAKLGGEQRPVPRIFGRPFELRPGRALSVAQLVQRLNDIGYAQRPKAEAAGEFVVAPSSVTLVLRPDGTRPPQTIKIDFSKGNSITKLTSGTLALDRLVLEAPLLTALAARDARHSATGSEKQRYVPLKSLPPHMINAVLTIEDRRFYDHLGVDVIRSVGAVITNLRGDKPYLVGASTITQQIVKNTFLTPEKTYRRKLQEQFMALVLESRFTKDQILELYLNEVVLGQRGPFEIHGVAEAARIFFGKDVRNVTIAEAATIAGVIQSPSRLSPFRNQERARERRNVVLHEMGEAKVITAEEAAKAAKEPLGMSMRALENEAPYFVDYVSQMVDEQYSGLLQQDAAVDVYTTLDLHLQRIAQEAVGDGIAQVDKQLAARKRKGQAQVALVAVDPRTGEILALVGGRAYNQSQFNRAVAAKRQPGSTFKPFVYLAAFERMAEEGRDDLTPATIVVDEPTTFKDGDKDYSPGNYQNEYTGPITLRRALALSRNIVTVKVAEATGYDRVAALWKRTGVGSAAQAFPSIALGVFEASPLDMAAAYTVFENGGQLKPLQAVTRIVAAKETRPINAATARRVARADATYLVTNMMRSVINEGTGASARGAGFTLDAAGKSGTTNDLRDAWFVGFTPELLTVVWVGFDDNQPIGLSGSQAALPIWTTFMRRALAGRPSLGFDVPDGISFAEIDKDTGQLATPNCPRVFREAFLAGTVPHEQCELHSVSVLDKLGGFFRKIIR
jgi:penicillin-binding protein 1B